MSNSQKHSKKNNNQVKSLSFKAFKLLFLESIIFLMSLLVLSTLITTNKQQKIKQLQEANQLLPRLEAKDKKSILFLLTKDTLLHTKQLKNSTNTYLSSIFIFSNVKPNLSIFLKGSAQLKHKQMQKVATNLYHVTASISPLSNFYPKLLEFKYKSANLFVPFILPSKNKKSCIKNSKQKIYFMPGINQYLITTTNSKNKILNEMPYTYYFCNNQFVLEKNKITTNIHWKTLYNSSDITIFSINNWLKIQLKSQKPIYLLLENAKLSANNISILPHLFFYENKDNRFFYIKKSDIYDLTATKSINITGTFNNQNFSIKLKNPNYIQIFNLTLTKNQVIFITVTVMLFIFNLILTKTYYQPHKFKTKKHV